VVGREPGRPENPVFITKNRWLLATRLLPVVVRRRAADLGRQKTPMAGGVSGRPEAVGRWGLMGGFLRKQS